MQQLHDKPKVLLHVIDVGSGLTVLLQQGKAETLIVPSAIEMYSGKTIAFSMVGDVLGQQL